MTIVRSNLASLRVSGEGNGVGYSVPAMNRKFRVAYSAHRLLDLFHTGPDATSGISSMTQQT